MKRYAIWNRSDNVITPVGEVLTPEKWIERWPVAGVPTIVPVVAAGEINGAFFGTLGEMVRRAEAEGCDFSACTTDEEKLAAIEAFEDAMAAEAAEAARKAAEQEASTAERQAAALEAIAAGQTTENAAALDALLNGEG